MSVIIATYNHLSLMTVSRKVELEVTEAITMTTTSLDTLHPEGQSETIPYLCGSGS